MKITTLTQFQTAFNDVAEKSPTKYLLIQKEINEIDDYVNFDLAETYNKPKFHRFHIKPKSQRIFDLKIPNYMRDFFSEAFCSHLKFGDYKPEKYSNGESESFQNKLDVLEQAGEFFSYYKWLNKLISTPQKEEKKSSLTHKQKLLALHYLGLDTSKFENSKTAKILSEILELSEDNTRQYLSYINAGKNEVRTKINLEKVNQLFENQGLSEISSTIKKDLEKL